MLRRLKNFLVGVACLLAVILFDLQLRRRAMPKKRNWFAWWGIAAMLIMVTSLLQCCTRLPVRTVPYVAILPDDLGATMSGRTICDLRGEPVVLVNYNVLNKPFLQYTLIHEYVHVAQSRRLRGGCRELITRYLVDPAFRLAVEGEAYCVVWRQENVDNVATHFDWLWLVHAMSQYGTESEIPCKESEMAKDGTYTKPP